MDTFLFVIYVVIFIIIIRKSSFFTSTELSPHWLSGIFLIKIGLGTGLTLIYTYYYSVKVNSDIFKYFDDSKVLYDALWESPWDGLMMLLGFDNNPDHFQQYYVKMNHWFRPYQLSTFNDSRTMIRLNALFRFFS